MLSLVDINCRGRRHSLGGLGPALLLGQLAQPLDRLLLVLLAELGQRLPAVHVAVARGLTKFDQSLKDSKLQGNTLPLC